MTSRTLIALAALPAVAIISSCKDNARKGFDQQLEALNEISALLEKASSGESIDSLEAPLKAAIDKYKAGSLLEEQATPAQRQKLDDAPRNIDALHSAKERLAAAIAKLSTEQKEKWSAMLQSIGF